MTSNCESAGKTDSKGRKMEKLQKYFEVLGITSDASWEEIQQAFKDCVNVWHPDRFCHNPRLQRKAEEKIKEINEAFETISSTRKNCREPVGDSESGTKGEVKQPNSGPVRYSNPVNTEKHEWKKYSVFKVSLITVLFFGSLKLIAQSQITNFEQKTVPPQTGQTYYSFSRMGRVVLAKESGGYYFYKIFENGEELWVACKSSVNVGDVIRFPDSPPAYNFESRTLKYTFPKVVFAPEVQVERN